MISAQIFAAVCFFAALCAVIAVWFCIRFLRLEKKQKALQLKLSAASHDICSPLTNIKGYADAMLDKTISQDKTEQALAVISMESDRVASLAGRLCGESMGEISVFGLCDEAARLCIIFENAAKAKGLLIEAQLPDDEIYVSADKDGITEALYNILNNAVKYCSDGGKISVIVKDCGKKAEISVVNDTLLEKTDVKNMFKPGYRGENSKGTSGMGLGLYIAHEIISQHGSQISAAFDDGKCTVKFCLDVAE